MATGSAAEDAGRGFWLCNDALGVIRDQYCRPHEGVNWHGCRALRVVLRTPGGGMERARWIGAARSHRSTLHPGVAMTRDEHERDDDAAVAGNELRIPLAEETVEAHVTERQKGKVVFTKRVETVPVEAKVDLRRDNVVVERREMDEVVDAPREPWYEGDTLVIPLYEERYVTEKRLVLREEVRVRNVPDVDHVTLKETVRREVVDIDEVPEEPPTSPA